MKGKEQAQGPQTEQRPGEHGHGLQMPAVPCTIRPHFTTPSNDKHLHPCGEILYQPTTVTKKQYPEALVAVTLKSGSKSLVITI